MTHSKDLITNLIPALDVSVEDVRRIVDFVSTGIPELARYEAMYPEALWRWMSRPGSIDHPAFIEANDHPDVVRQATSYAFRPSGFLGATTGSCFIAPDSRRIQVRTVSASVSIDLFKSVQLCSQI